MNEVTKGSGGAVIGECGNISFRSRTLCGCQPKCSLCLNGPHMAVHRGYADKGDDSPPYDHEYQSEPRTHD